MLGVGAEQRWGLRAAAAGRWLLNAMLFGLTPFVAFFNIARLEITADVGAGLVAGWVALAGAGALAYLVGRRLLDLDRPQTGTVVTMALQANTGYLGLPLCVAVLGTDALPQAIAYDTLVQSPMFLLGVFGVGAAFGTRAGEGLAARVRAFAVRNPPLIAVVAGLLAPAALAPDLLVDASRVVVFALLPLGFFAVGVTLAQESADGAVAIPPPLTRVVAGAVVLRIAVAPAILLAIAMPFSLPAPYLLLAAMPAGINALVVAHAYGLDAGLASATIAWSTALVLGVGLVATAFA